LSGATLCQAFRPAPGEARPDWAIFAELGRRLGFAEQFAWSDEAAVYAEFAALTTGRLCDGTGLSKALLAAHGPQQWPSLSLRHCPRRRSSATLRSTGALPGGRRPAITSPPPAAGRASGPIRPSAWPPPRNWGESQAELACEANRLMHELGCPLYGQPELKGAAVRLEALGSPSN
jgi:hypothetical protein